MRSANFRLGVISASLWKFNARPWRTSEPYLWAIPAIAPLSMAAQ
jgi:hypothetical protein